MEYVNKWPENHTKTWEIKHFKGQKETFKIDAPATVWCQLNHTQDYAFFSHIKFGLFFNNIYIDLKFK